MKRYVLATLGEGGDLGEVVEATEHALGGCVVDPPGYAGRSGDGRHRWTREVASVAFRRAIADVVTSFHDAELLELSAAPSTRIWERTGAKLDG
ncbi:MAG: hypothetical protein ABSB55_03015 [Acidimicrobiales bacterium]